MTELISLVGEALILQKQSDMRVLERRQRLNSKDGIWSYMIHSNIPPVVPMPAPDAKARPAQREGQRLVLLVWQLGECVLRKS